MKKLTLLSTMLTLILISPLKSFALELNQDAPNFTAPSTSGKNVSLSDFKGEWVVLYFFPKTFTPGCTAQSCSLRDRIKTISKENARVLGVSLDNVESQQKFKAKYNLPFELISDDAKKISKAYDTLGVLGLYAKRKTFIISPDGKIAYIFEKAGTTNHSEEVLSQLQILKQSTKGK